MRSETKATISAVAAALGALLCFYSVPVLLRHFRGYLDPWWVNAVRCSMATVFLLPFMRALSRRQSAGRSSAGKGSIWRAALVPAAVNTVAQVGWAAAPYFVEASVIGFVIQTSFLFTILLGFLLVPAERALARKLLFYVGAAASLAGVAVMYAGRASPKAGSLKELAGLGIVLATAMAWGAYAVTVRRFLAGFRLRMAFGVICLYTTLPLLVLMLIFGEHHRLAAVPGRVWALMLGSGISGIALGHLLYHRSVHGIGPVVTNGLSLAGPFVTCLAAAIFLNEAITGMQLVGGLVVVAGGAGLVLARARIDRDVAAPLRGGR